MTDVIVEGKDGTRIHYQIPDDHPAIVYVREEGTFRVKKADLYPERKVLRLLELHRT